MKDGTGRVCLSAPCSMPMSSRVGRPSVVREVMSEWRSTQVAELDQLLKRSPGDRIPGDRVPRDRRLTSKSERVSQLLAALRLAPTPLPDGTTSNGPSAVSRSPRAGLDPKMQGTTSSSPPDEETCPPSIASSVLDPTTTSGRASTDSVPLSGSPRGRLVGAAIYSRWVPRNRISCSMAH